MSSRKPTSRCSMNARRISATRAVRCGAGKRRSKMTAEWGPLGALIGDWEGEGGLDAAFSHSRNKVLDTPC